MKARGKAAGAALIAIGMFVASPTLADVRVHTTPEGQTLQVDGEDFMAFGMNWGYMPIGQNYTYDFWGLRDEVIWTALQREMTLLQAMGVNTIRQFDGIPPRWVEHIYETYGIYTIINHTVARYGYNVDGAWIPNTDYSDPRLREVVTNDVLAMAETYKDTPGILMYLLGNENNYGLSWSSFEIEALPEGEQNTARAHFLYSLFGDITRGIKKIDTTHPVAMANGDLQYIDLIAEHCKELDVLGTNVYRGISARDLFQVVKDKLGIPVMFTEFGSDAYNAKEEREDQAMQARYLLGQWQEIYEQSSGKGRVGNAIGGLIFQWSDGWWKYLQDERLDVHDTNASWPNGGYSEDYVEGDNNMNEEWFGIVAKGPPDADTLYDVYPRAAYYALTDAFKLDPYAETTTLETIAAHFAPITPSRAELQARGNRATLLAESSAKIGVSGLRIELETYSTGGERTTTPGSSTPNEGVPAFRGFDQMQSVFATIQAKPTQNVTGSVTLNVLGDVPDNPIDEIFYEDRGRERVVVGNANELEDETTFDEEELPGIERVKVYQANLSWIDRWFLLDAFYRTGHYHWGYQGDFFGLYREANYGENVDIYNGVAPVGAEFTGRRSLGGLKLAVGPELWWGANPAILAKYTRKIGPWDVTAMFHEDLSEQSTLVTTIAVPLPKTRKATLQLAGSRGKIGYELGGIWSGDTKVGDTFDIAEEQADGSYLLVRDEIKDEDTLGAKVKITYQRGPLNWYAQAAYMGLVADGGPTQPITYTGWGLKDSGSGNQKNVITGVAYNIGRFQISPNFLYQVPIVGPIPVIEPDIPVDVRPRNVLDDPFAVRANREMVGSELMITYDPTPATWMWQWDSIIREDSKFAASLGFIHRHMPTTQDAAIGQFDVEGVSELVTGSFGAATPARDLWEVRARVMSKLSPSARFVGHLYGGTAEPNGDDQRRIERWGADGRLALGSIAMEAAVAVDDWGPYDYHRDFNNTFPLQLRGDLSYALGPQRWFGFPQTKFGVRGQWRSLNSNSPRYCPGTFINEIGQEECLETGDEGNEWEIRTYVHFAM